MLILYRIRGKIVYLSSLLLITKLGPSPEYEMNSHFVMLHSGVLGSKSGSKLHDIAKARIAIPTIDHKITIGIGCMT